MPSQEQIMLNTGEVAAILQVKTHTLYTWRAAGKGPKYAKIGRKILYSAQDISEFIQSKKQEANQ